MSFQELIEKGEDPNTRDANSVTPLHMAAIFGQADVVSVLVEKGADPNTRDISGDTPLNLAAEAGHVDVVARLLEASADPERVERFRLDAVG